MKLRAAGALLLAVTAHAADLKSLYDAHQWFELREALRSDSGTPLYRIAVAAAFNDVRHAEEEFNAFLKTATDADGPTVGEMAQWIIPLHGRNGRYRDVIQGTKVPELGNLPTLQVVDRVPSVVRGEVGETGHLLAPVAVNGHGARFAVDTGATISTVTESEAKRLGLTTIPGRPATGWFGGAVSRQRLAAAATLEIGRFRFRNVAFIVVPDGALQKASGTLTGTVGLPLLMAMGTFAWNPGGDLQFGYPSEPGPSNLCFDGWIPAARIEFRQRKIYAILDTGNPASQWWPALTRQFPDLLQQNPVKKMVEVFGGDSPEAEATIVPQFTFRIAGSDLTQTNAQILTAESTPIGAYYAGILGLDPLMQVRQVTIDFKNLIIKLR